MKIIHKYVLREHIGPLAFALSALTSLMLLNYVAKQLGNLVGKGLSWNVIGEFFLLSVPFTVAMTLPMAILVSVLYAFSRLASENEITALKANGVSIAGLLGPVLVGSAILSLVMVIFNDQILPRANHRLRTLQGDIARKKPTFALKEQIINEVSPQQFFLRTNHLDRSTNKMKEVTIYDLSDPLRRRTIYADSGIMNFAEGGSDLQLKLFDGFMQEIPRETPTQLQRLFYKVDLIRVPGVANAFSRDSGDTYKSDREMSVCELQNEVARFERDYFRSFDDYKRAAAAQRRDPRAQVDQLIMSPSIPGQRAPRARRRTLGRTYCDALLYLEKRGLGNLTLLSLGTATNFILPTSAFAQSAPAPRTIHALPLASQDTGRAKNDTTKRTSSDTSRAAVTDTTKRSVADSTKNGVADTTRRPAPDSVKQRADSVKHRADSILKATPPPPLPPGVRVVNGDTIYPGLTVAPGPVTNGDSGSATHGPPGSLPPSAAPSAGISSSLPAAVAMEASRGTMVAARNQMDSFDVEIQKKFAISAACVVFVLLGAPLALRFPRGGVGLVIGVSLGVFALYYVGLIAGEALADRGILSPFWAMWAANILFTAVGVVLLSRIELTSSNSRGGDLSEFLDRFKRRRAKGSSSRAQRH
ncbi:MAG: LptF/LptG family permease [Gemmatimonadaceae bacterium]